MDYETNSPSTHQKYSETDIYVGNDLVNDQFLTVFPSEKVLKLNHLNLKQLNYNKAQENIQNIKDVYLGKIESVSDRKRNLESDIDNLSNSTSNILREIQINDVSFNLINEELNDVYKEIEESKNTLNLLRNEKSQLTSLLSSKTEDYESYFKDQEPKEGWPLKLSYLELLLGVKVSSENGAMRIEFSRLNSSNSHRSCSIVLKLVDDSFIGILCEPQIKNFGKFVSDLNNGMDFGTFLCNVRQSFKTSL